MNLRDTNFIIDYDGHDKGSIIVLDYPEYFIKSPKTMASLLLYLTNLKSNGINVLNFYTKRTSHIFVEIKGDENEAKEFIDRMFSYYPDLYEKVIVKEILPLKIQKFRLDLYDYSNYDDIEEYLELHYR